MKVLDGVRTGISVIGYKVMDILGQKSGEFHEKFASDKYLLQQEEITRLQKEVASMIKYPPTPSGVPVLTEHDILFAYRAIIKETYLAAGMVEGHEDLSTPCFMNTYMPAIRQVVHYFHLLPASEFHHHNEVGGLLRHSLEVALMTLRMCKAKTPKPIGFQDVEKLRLPRWRFAAWLSGLIHDAGKIISDMRVHGKEVPTQWNPQIESLYDFAERHGIERYTVSWNPHRANHYHEKLSGLLLDKVLSDMSKRWLYDSSDNLSGPIIEALQNYTHRNGFIEEPMRKADALSSERDRRTQYHYLMGDRKSGIAHAFINSLRHLKKNKWNKVNEYGARVFVIDEEVYLDYRNGIMEIIQDINKDAKRAGQNARIINSSSKTVNIMEELGIIEPMHEESDFVRLTFKDKRGNPRQTDLVRVSYPNLVFEDSILPPNLTDCQILLSSMGETLTISKNGHVDYQEPAKNPYQTIYNLDPENGSQVNRNSGRSLNINSNPKTKDELLAANQSPPNSSTSNAAGSTMGHGAQPTHVEPTPTHPVQQPSATPAQAPTNTNQVPTGNNQKPPANTPKGNGANASKKRGSNKPLKKSSKPQIKFENEDEGCWAGININADESTNPDSKSVTIPQSQISLLDSSDQTPANTGNTEQSNGISLSVDNNESAEVRHMASVKKVHSNTNNTKPAPNRLRSVRKEELITLCYIIAYGLSEIPCDKDTLIAVEKRPAMYINKFWLETVLHAIEPTFDESKYLQQLTENHQPSNILGLQCEEYISISAAMHRAVGELLNEEADALSQQSTYLNCFGRTENNFKPDSFKGKLKITQEHEVMILKSDLAKELKLDKHGVINV